MLAYVFWHEPRDGEAVASYEAAIAAFHRSLARSAPVGLRGSNAFRIERPPWMAGAGETCYEDWYLLADYTALGVLNEAAVGRGHRSSHDDAARRFGAGAGALYGLIEGRPEAADATLVTWVTRPPGAPKRDVEDLLGDGLDPARASLWRRQLVLGPAPEFALLASEQGAGVAPARLPTGWSATPIAREALWSG